MRYHLFHQFSFMSGFPPFPLAFFCRLHQRNDERKLKANSNRPVEKIGYVTRNKQAEGMKASGFSSAAMMGKQDPDQVKKEYVYIFFLYFLYFLYLTRCVKWV